MHEAERKSRAAVSATGLGAAPGTLAVLTCDEQRKTQLEEHGPVVAFQAEDVEVFVEESVQLQEHGSPTGSACLSTAGVLLA